MKKKILAMVLSLAMAATMLPATSVQAADGVTAAAPTQLSDEIVDLGLSASSVKSDYTASGA